jgi:hypothetical protein
MAEIEGNRGNAGRDAEEKGRLTVSFRYREFLMQAPGRDRRTTPPGAHMAEETESISPLRGENRAFAASISKRLTIYQGVEEEKQCIILREVVRKILLQCRPHAVSTLRDPDPLPEGLPKRNGAQH